MFGWKKQREWVWGIIVAVLLVGMVGLVVSARANNTTTMPIVKTTGYGITGGNTTTTAQYNLHGRYVLSGTEERGVAGATVVVEALDAQGTVDLNGAWWHGVTSAVSATSTISITTGGEFWVGELSPGTYQVRLATLPTTTDDNGMLIYGNYMVPTPHTIIITDSTMLYELGSLVVPLAPKRISGTVSNADGSGVANVRVEATRLDSTQDGIAPFLFADTLADGTYTIPVAGGEWRVRPIAADERNGAWLFTDDAQYAHFITVSDTTPEINNVTIHFTVQTAVSYITGMLVQPNSTTPYTKQASLMVQHESGLRYAVPTHADGTFHIPAQNGYHTISLWVNDDSVAAQPIAPVVVTGADVAIGSIALLPRMAPIDGTVVDNNNTPIANYPLVVLEATGNRQFVCHTNTNGEYHVMVPVGNWYITPRNSVDDNEYGDSATLTYLYEGTGIHVTRREDDALFQTNIPFTLTLATKRVSGTFLTNNGTIKDVPGVVFLTRTPHSVPIATAKIQRGSYTLRMPNDCTECRIHVQLANNSRYSLRDTSKVITADTMNFAVKENSASVHGTFISADSGNAVSGITGNITLTPINDNNPTYIATINQYGSYVFSAVGTGTYHVNYRFDTPTVSPVVMAGGIAYLNAPLFPTKFTLETDSNTMMNIILGTAETFDVRVQHANGSAVQYTHPANVTCAYQSLDGSWGTSANSTHKRTIACATANDTPSRLVCARANDSNTSIATSSAMPMAFAALPHSSLSSALPITCTVAVGDAAATRATTSAPATTTFTETHNTTVAVRERDMSLVGQVVNEQGMPITNSLVMVSGFSASDDGQTALTTTNEHGEYRLAVASANTTWTIRATMSNGAEQYEATGCVVTTVISESNSKDEHEIAGPRLMMLLQQTPRIQPTDNMIVPNVPTHIVVQPPRDAADGEPIVAQLTIDMDKGAVKTLSGSTASIALSAVPVANTSTHTVLGDAYHITIRDEATGRMMATNNEDATVAATLSFAINTTALAQHNLSIDAVQPALYDTTTNNWGVLQHAVLIEETNELVVSIAHMNHLATDAIGLVVPTDDVRSTSYRLLLPWVMQ